MQGEKPFQALPHRLRQALGGSREVESVEMKLLGRLEHAGSSWSGGYPNLPRAKTQATTIFGFAQGRMAAPRAKSR
jgi:hypothetical protein